jgi:hypothetical protein
MTKREAITAQIIRYFEENESTFNECMEDLDDWNGYLGDNRYYGMEMLNEFYSGVDPLEVLERAYYGRDDDSWHTDASGNKIYGEFNPNREYFYYNGYGNLCSSDYKDYSAYLDAYFVEALEDARDHLYSIDGNAELSGLFDELEKADDESDDGEEV